MCIRDSPTAGCTTAERRALALRPFRTLELAELRVRFSALRRFEAYLVARKLDNQNFIAPSVT
eukprot:879644-Alexandrium_andersonii.AAC.1